MAGGDGRLCGRDAKYSSRREKNASCDGVSRSKGGEAETDLVFEGEVGEHAEGDGMGWRGRVWECSKQRHRRNQG